ncbi:MAG: response regulator [Gemmatimonadota bacterium]
MTDPTTRNEPDLRTLLIRAALEILEEPDTPLDLRKVAERAGKSRTAPYLVFGKEREGGGVVALRLAVAAEGMRRLLREVTRVAHRKADPLTAFHDVAEGFFRFAKEHERLFRLMFGPEIGVASRLGTAKASTQREFRDLVEVRRQLEALVQWIIQRAQEHRLLSSGEARRQTMMAWATLQGIALLLLDDVVQLAGEGTTSAEAANLAAEAVMGTTPTSMTQAALFLREAQEQKARVAEADEPEVAWTLDRLAAPPLEDRPEIRDSFGALDERDLSAPPEPDLSAIPRASMPAPSSPAKSRRLGRIRASAPEQNLPSLHNTISHPALRRALAARTALRGARILWIDDHPEWIEWERRMLERLEIEVTTAANTGRALKELGADSYDLILSDIARGSRRDEGVAALPNLRSVAPDTPVIFYVGAVDEGRGLPPGSAGITNQPDELLHLVLDVLERRRS